MAFKEKDNVLFRGHKAKYRHLSITEGQCVIEFDVAYVQENFPDAKRFAADSYIRADTCYLWVWLSDVSPALLNNRESAHLLSGEFS